MIVLITGGAGYIGCALTSLLLDAGHKVIIYDSLLYNPEVLIRFCASKKFQFVEGDVRDQVKLRPLLNGCDFIFPLAAIVGAPACDKKKLEATQVNLDAVRFIADTTNAKIIYPNTNSGYGTRSEPCTEETSFQPISHYAVTKTSAEKYLLQNTDAITLRLATIFGISSRMRLDLLVNDFVFKAFVDRYIVLFEKNASRNFLHVQDAARSFLYLAENFSRYAGEIFNVGLPATLSKYEIAKIIGKFTPFSIQSDELAEDPDKRNYTVSSEKLLKTGWQFNHTLEDGIEEILKAAPILAKSKWNNL